MTDKLIEEVTTGGEVVFEERNRVTMMFHEGYFPLAVGDTEAKLLKRTYLSELKVPFQYSVTEEIEPEIRGGKARPNRGKQFSVDIKFPCETYNIKGSIALDVRVKEDMDIHKTIMDAIGASLLELGMKSGER